MNRFENGFHSFKKAIMTLKKENKDEFELKEILINLHHSIEVLFKFILFNEQKLFIFKDIDKLIEQKFNKKLEIENADKNEEFFTISFDDTIKRIFVLFEWDIDKYTYNKIKNLNKCRNHLIHGEFDLLNDEVEHLIVSILPSIIFILKKYLPKVNEEEFSKFIDDEKISKEISLMYINNEIWRIITITNLLTLYKSIETSNKSKNYMNKMISMLGCQVEEEDPIVNIDGKFYLLTVSYLKQEICNYIIFSNSKEKFNNEKIKELISNNKIIIDVCKEYIQNMAYYLVNLINFNGDKKSDFFENVEALNSYFDETSLINKIDIYEILFYMRKSAISCIKACNVNNKSYNNFFEQIFIDDTNVNVNTIYSNLIKLYINSKWYNVVNFKELPVEVFDVFIKDEFLQNEIEENVFDKIYDLDIFCDLIGEWGEWGSIDTINDPYIEGIDIIIENNKERKEYTLVLNISVSTQTYSDHEFYDIGSEQTYVSVKGWIDVNAKFIIENLKYIGCKKVLNGFKFE